jgi:hypothetical protein
MEWFAYLVKVDENDEKDMINGQYPEANFNTFYEAVLIVFDVLTGDTWVPKYFLFYWATGGTAASFFFISLVLLG